MNATVEWENAEEASALEWLVENSGEGEAYDDEASAMTTLQGVGGGALAGASAGAALGPYGALAGGVIGGVAGGIGAGTSGGSGRQRQPARAPARPRQQAAAPRPAQPTPARPAPAGRTPAGTGACNCARLEQQIRMLTAAVAGLARSLRAEAQPDQGGEPQISDLGEPGAPDQPALPAGDRPVQATEVLGEDVISVEQSEPDETSAFLESILEPGEPDTESTDDETLVETGGLPEVDIEEIQPACHVQAQ